MSAPSHDASAWAQQILDAAARRADAAEVFVQQGEAASVQFENNRLHYVSARVVRGAGLRVIHRGRIGFSSTTDPEDLGRLVDNALASAAFGQEAKFAFPGPAAVPSPSLFDPRVADFPLQEAIARCRGAIEQLLAYDASLDCAAGADKAAGAAALVNTSGLALSEEASSFDIGLHALRVDDDGTLTSVDEGHEWRRLDADLERHVRDAIEKLEHARRTVRLRAETLPVIFAPEALGVLLATLTANANGKALQKGTSLLKGRVGERVLHEAISLWDDPLTDWAPGSGAFDGEGLPSRPVSLFERGVFRQFYSDLQTAGALGVPPTASAVRSYASQPSPGIGNLRMAPGETPWREMLGGLPRGLYVCEVLGAGQSNVLAGEFSLNVELGFLVEKGAVAGRVKDAMLAGNAFDAFRRVAAVSRETEWHGASELPYVCFEGLSVVGSES